MGRTEARQCLAGCRARKCCRRRRRIWRHLAPALALACSAFPIGDALPCPVYTCAPVEVDRDPLDIVRHGVSPVDPVVVRFRREDVKEVVDEVFVENHSAGASQSLSVLAETEEEGGFEFTLERPQGVEPALKLRQTLRLVAGLPQVPPDFRGIADLHELPLEAVFLHRGEDDLSGAPGPQFEVVQGVRLADGRWFVSGDDPVQSPRLQNSRDF